MANSLGKLLYIATLQGVLLACVYSVSQRVYCTLVCTDGALKSFSFTTVDGNYCGLF